jgi:secreted PhoX family phosphatase
MKIKALTLAVVSLLAIDANALDFGQKIEQLLKSSSLNLFGTLGTLNASSTAQVAATAPGCDMISLAAGLSCSVVSEKPNLSANIDMMVLWPNDSNPTHIIACNEQGATGVGVQRIRLSDGVAENIVASGLTSCDPAEITPWGTVIIGEENGSNGRMFEILDPLTTTDVVVSGAGLSTTTTDNAHVRYVTALGQLSFEGISVLPNGVTLYQDERRPGTSTAGGAYYKFIPTTLWNGGPAITNLDNSPLASGRIFGLRLGRNGGNTDFSAGNNAGRGVWVEVTDGKFGAPTTTPGVDRINLQNTAQTLKLFAQYRPEDQDIDLGALALGNVRVCGANTGQDTTTTNANGANNFGTTFCITDGTVATSAVINTLIQTVGTVSYAVNTGSGTTIPEYQTLVEHFLDFGMPDNVAYQPRRGNWIIQEDGDGSTYTPARNNDIWSCLDDGADKDLLSDGCVKIATINDLTAETTGGVFNSIGNEYYVSIQHNISGHGVILKITGWQ